EARSARHCRAALANARPWIAGPACPEGQCSAMDDVHDRIFKRQGQAPADPSELQATLAGSVGQRLDAAVVAVAGAVERDLFNAGGARLFGDRTTDPGGG